MRSPGVFVVVLVVVAALVVVALVLVAAAMQEPCSLMGVLRHVARGMSCAHVFLSDEMFPLAGPLLLLPAAFVQAVCWCVVCVVEVSSKHIMNCFQHRKAGTEAAHLRLQRGAAYFKAARRATTSRAECRRRRHTAHSRAEQRRFPSAPQHSEQSSAQQKEGQGTMAAWLWWAGVVAPGSCAGRAPLAADGGRERRAVRCSRALC